MVSQVPGPRILSPVESTRRQPPDLGQAGSGAFARRRQSAGRVRHGQRGESRKLEDRAEQTHRPPRSVSRYTCWNTNPECNDLRWIHEWSSAFAAGERHAALPFEIGTEINREAAKVADRMLR